VALAGALQFDRLGSLSRGRPFTLPRHGPDDSVLPRQTNDSDKEPWGLMFRMIFDSDLFRAVVPRSHRRTCRDGDVDFNLFEL
jgi:hypothetical protein